MSNRPLALCCAVLLTLLLGCPPLLAQTTDAEVAQPAAEQAAATEPGGDDSTEDTAESDGETDVVLSEKEEVALEVLAGSNEDPEVARRMRKQAEQQAQHEQDRVEAEESSETAPAGEQQGEGVPPPAQPGAEETDTDAVATPPPPAVTVEEPGTELLEPATSDTGPRDTRYDLELYASARLHGINVYDADDNNTEAKLGDGASRVGGAAYINTPHQWEFYGRLEWGFDIIESFTSKAQVDTDAKLPLRLAHVGVDSKYFNLKAGKSWSSYYKVAGAADLFSVFGADAAGVYNAGTDGGGSGTGRADEALQTQVFVDLGKWISFKPFNVNLQYQWDQPIPQVEGEEYSGVYGVSTWFEHWNDIGIGFTYHRATLDNEYSPQIRAAGIDGDLRARALAIKSYGDKWLASLVLGSHDNLETTDQDLYINAEAAELFIQRRVSDRIWLVGGGNWLWPDEDDPDAGDYKIAYGVLGARYTFDGLKRMIYLEWKEESSRRTDGQRLKNEVTFGVRWDFSY